ncbi:MAG TPA: glycosyltransferase [Bacteroidia bacterium]|jgi:glycosyltransferase involved in cell wall biosynthesis|nr:glycosyltransferase [Bacteroidia bacterium]
MKYLFLSPWVWNNYRNRNIEIPIGVSAEGNECIYVNPVKYKNWEKIFRLQNISTHATGSVKVIERFSRLPKSFFLLLYENYDNMKMVRKNKPEVVVSWDYLMSLFACIYCKLKGIPFVFDAMDDWEEIEKNKGVRLYYKYIAKPVLTKLSYAITATSHKQVEVFGRHNKRVFLIPNGKPMDFIKKTGEYIIQNMEEGRTINFIATLRDWYDFDLLFDVFREFPELQLNIYGEGELFEYLKNKSAQYSNITMKGHADSELLPRLIAESLFGVLPLKLNKLNDSTCPIKLFDYWSAKKAVIASPTYEMQKISENGGMVLAAKKQEYINAIRLLLNDKALRDSIGEKGYRNMLEKYNYDIIIPQFIASVTLDK